MNSTTYRSVGGTPVGRRGGRGWAGGGDVVVVGRTGGADGTGDGLDWLSRAKPTPRFTYGLRGSSILAALFNAVLLLIACGAITLEAVQRFSDPTPVPGRTVMIVAGIGIVINLGTALLFARGGKGDINIRGAFLHMAADAAVSAGVVVAGLLTLRTGAAWIDPATSLLIVLVIVAGTWGLLRESLAMAMQAVPVQRDCTSRPRSVCGGQTCSWANRVRLNSLSASTTAVRSRGKAMG